MSALAPDENGPTAVAAVAPAAADDAHPPAPFGSWVDPKVRVCAYCKKPWARKKCNGCQQRTYCDKKCQKKDWHKQHRVQCKKLRQVFVPPPPGWRDTCPPVAEAAAASSKNQSRRKQTASGKKQDISHQANKQQPASNK